MQNLLMMAILLIFAVMVWHLTQKPEIRTIKRVLCLNMAAVAGTDFDIGIDVAGGSSFSVLGQDQGLSVSFTTDKADATTKDSLNWEENISTIRHVSVSGNGVLDETDTAWGKLLTAYFTTAGPAQVEIQITTPGAVTFTGLANIDSLDYDGPHDGTLNFSIALSGNGVFVKA